MQHPTFSTRNFNTNFNADKIIEVVLLVGGARRPSEYCRGTCRQAPNPQGTQRRAGDSRKQNKIQ